ncbi:SANT/Myb-like DNA-binding domain-containing protein [Bradyrhizobium sp. CCGUVB23]|nr:SANT/Myb-like DNA-binding domain-containing protein [Bradyrhizobium sp. CCGUVB23]MCP3462621.1 SANT/Myb-like DNA-binding domain-containing protein [Bradyrhizobium sp. CCGUVB23]
MQTRYPTFKRWTAEDHERLRVLAASGHRPDRIAHELQRTEAAVRSRAWQYNIALQKKQNST